MTETPAEFNTTVIDEFRANEGRVGGIWEATPVLLLHHTGAKSGGIGSTRSPTYPAAGATS